MAAVAPRSPRSPLAPRSARSYSPQPRCSRQTGNSPTPSSTRFGSRKFEEQLKHRRRDGSKENQHASYPTTSSKPVLEDVTSTNKSTPLTSLAARATRSLGLQPKQLFPNQPESPRLDLDRPTRRTLTETTPTPTTTSASSASVCSHTSFANPDASDVEAEQALDAVRDAIRDEKVRVSCARMLLEGTSKRLEDQLERMTRIVEPVPSATTLTPSKIISSQMSMHSLTPVVRRIVTPLSPQMLKPHSSHPCTPQRVSLYQQLHSPRTSGSCFMPDVTLRNLEASPVNYIHCLPLTRHSSIQHTIPKVDSEDLERQRKETLLNEKKDLARKQLAKALEHLSDMQMEDHHAVSKLTETRDRLSLALQVARDAKLTKEEVLSAELHRRRLHNSIQDLKGQLRVYCRVRPMNAAEKRRGDAEVLRSVSSMGLEVVGSSGLFEFDGVFAAGSQEDIFEDCRDVAQSAIDGHNATIFAFGQTGAGKTYTMHGSAHDEGISQRMIRELFAQVEWFTDIGEKISIAGSMLELYNNSLIDLLRPVDRRGRQYPPVEIHLKSDVVEVEGLERLQATNIEELKAILERGLAQRSVASNALNLESSRSHVIFTVTITRPSLVHGTVVSKLHICDLGGCERLKKTEVTGDTRREAIEINKSLTALGDVIEAVVSKKKHIPYRNHKLTLLLQDAIGGSAKALMYLNCSPASSSVRETALALKFGSRAKTVVNQPLSSLKLAA